MCDDITTPKCNICDAVSGLLRCAKCKSAYYCSPSHQHADWSMHKLECRRLAKQRKDANGVWATTREIAQLMSTSDAEFLNPMAESLNQGQNVSVYGMNDSVTKRGVGRMPETLLSIKDANRFALDLGAASEKRYDELCRNIINDMNMYGLSVIDDFLGMEQGLEIFNEVHKMYAAGVFRDGQLVSNKLGERDLRTIRGDKITWVKGTEDGCSNIGFLINKIDAIVSTANTMQNNGQLGNYRIRERTKAMVACYPGSGSHYVTHVDNPNKDGRIITAIYYLNLNWDVKRSGGVLRIFPEQGGSVADIEPKFDRIIFFWSDRRNPHEVQPAHRTRYAITVWYFDANEREQALNRCRQYNHQTNCT